MNSPTAASTGSVVVRPAGPPSRTRSRDCGSRRAANRTRPSNCSWRTACTRASARAKITIPVLRGVDFAVGRGQFTAVVGQSGSGKSTLLHVLATLDAPDAGEVHFEGRRIDNLPPVKRDRIRNRRPGHDLPVLSPAAGTHDARKRAGADHDLARASGGTGAASGPTSSGPKDCWTWSDCRTACSTGRASCREAKCSGRPSHAP